MVAAVRDFGDLLPSEQESAQARESSHVLSMYARRAEPLQVEVSDNEYREVISLPAGAVRLLFDMLTEMAEGNAVTLMPMHAELTTQKAADILNISRPYLVKLLDAGMIGHRKVGTHRRVLLCDLLAYKYQVDQERISALDELTRQARELDMGYQRSVANFSFQVHYCARVHQ